MYSKNLIFFVLCIGLVFAPWSSTYAQIPDCNQDGLVTSADLTCVILGIFAPPEPEVSCPCNFDLDFWTQDAWNDFTPNGLFDGCVIATIDQTQISRTLIGVPSFTPPELSFSCRATLAIVTPPPPGTAECKARVSCSAIFPVQFIVDIYDERLIVQTDAEGDACVKDFFSIADALPINPCNQPQ